jgi:tetratricopeptide (TPR) repeat protein
MEHRISTRTLSQRQKNIAVNASFSALKSNFFWFLLFAACSGAYPATSFFWADQIDSALNQKETSFTSLDISLDSTAIQSWDFNRKLATLEALDFSPLLDNPWYHITRGLIDGSLSDTNQAVFFNRALFLAQNDPGTVWLLFFEFQRNRIYPWADKCLEQLHKLMLQSGALSCRLISRQLLYVGINQEKKDKADALRIYNWAKKFDSDQNILAKRIAWNHFPFDLSSFIHEYKYILYQLKNSWNSQLQMVTGVYGWLRDILMLLALVPLLILTLKYIPYTLHRISDILPYAMPLFLRTPLVTLTYFSTALLNFYALLWTSAFLIWRHLSHQEKKLLGISLVLLVFSPIDSYIRGAFYLASDPTGPLKSFSRAVNEGYTEDQYKTTVIRTSQDKKDYMAALSASIYDLKNHNFTSATTNIRNIQSLPEDDPVFLITAGNLHFLKNDIEKAELFYKQILKKDKKNAEALFNLAQCQLQKLKTITATEYISDAANIKPDLVNSFIQNNENYFSRNWPPLRQIMFADLSPKIFWTRYFPDYALKNKTASVLWNPYFFAIPPMISAIVFLVLLTILLILFRDSNEQTKLKKIFECRFCGRIICRKCKSGILCQSCHKATQFMSNEKSLEKMRKIISTQAKKINLVKCAIVGVLYPGADKFLEPEMSIWKVIFNLLATSVAYATYKLVFSCLSASCLEPLLPLILLLVLPIIYNVYFIVRTIQKTIQGFKSQDA